MSKNYLVFGGTNGIGQAIVEQVVRERERESRGQVHVVVVYGHDDDAAAQLKNKLKCKSAKIDLIKCDMSNRENIAPLFESISSLFSSENPIDRLICNVGIGTYKPFDEYQFEDWDKVMETNLTIPIFLVQRFKKSDLLSRDASILLMSSLMGKFPHSTSLAYGITKAGLSFAAKQLVKEFEPQGIRINALAPGFTETRWHKDRSTESYDRINAKIALHRFGSPDEVADAAVFLLENSYMNGAVLTIDGGYNYF